MKVLTLNMWGAYGPPERRPVLREAILQTDADLLLLQEANLPDNFLESISYPVQLHFPEAGLAVLSRFPAWEKKRFTYKVVSTLEPHLRGALFAQLETNGKNLWAGTTHLAWKGDDSATRLAQVEELLAFAVTLPDPVLIGGDFNAAPTDPPIQRMIAAGFKDLHAEGEIIPPSPFMKDISRPSSMACPAEGGTEGGGGITWDNRNPFIQSHSVKFPDRRIDYLFLRDAQSLFTLLRCEVACREREAGGLHPSDHYGVLAFFQR